MARVDSLPQEIKGLLQTVSVVGRESSYDLIKRLTGLTEQELLSHLSVLKDSELLYERGIYPQSTFIFKHALTQEIAYSSLLQKRKKEIHEGIGRAMEALYPDRLEEHYELLAYHYGRSANADKAVQYLDLANQKVARCLARDRAEPTAANLPVGKPGDGVLYTLQGPGVLRSFDPLRAHGDRVRKSGAVRSTL
jgi:predicted ATPase